jgi:hypothetical protein
MPEWRVAKVMGQTRGRNNLAYRIEGGRIGQTFISPS